MSVYLNNIAVGLVVFPLLALVVTIPYMVYQYRKFGSIPKWRSFLVYLFAFYLLCAYFLVILPLPESRTAMVPYAQDPQLMPFHFLEGIFVWSGFSLADPGTWVNAAKNYIFLESAFNVFLFVPLGMFCRYYFKRSWWQVLVIGALVSLFFEVSQLTGLFGLYAYPYRLFDVDDLILNAFGTLVGFWVMGPASKLLPNMTVIDQEAREQGLQASLVRRALAFLFDFLLAEAAVAAAGLLLTLFGAGFVSVQPGGVQFDSGHMLAFAVAQAASWAVFFVLLPALSRGQTLGQKALKLAIVGLDAGKVPWYRIAARYGLLFLPFIVVAGMTALFLSVRPQETDDLSAFTFYILEHQVVLIAVLTALAAGWLASIPLRSHFIKKRGGSLVMLNELISGTRVMTTAGAASLQDRMVVLDVAEVASLERMIAQDGTSLADLMEAAGLSVSQAIRERNPRPTSVAVLCGTGNNGGDGWVVARDLATRGYEVVVVSPLLPTEVQADPGRAAAIKAFSVAKGNKGSLRIVVKPDALILAKSLAPAEVVVDAMLGTGFSGQFLREPFEGWINAVNRHRTKRKDAFVVAVDVPSGYSAQTGEHAHPCIKADLTVTMLAYKPGLLAPDAKAYCGTVRLSRLADVSAYLGRLQSSKP